MTELTYIQEPLLAFGGGQTHQYSRVGLTLFGPHEHPSERVLRIGFIGPAEGLERIKLLLNRLSQPFRSPDFEQFKIPFPGFEAVFGCALPELPRVVLPLNLKTLESLLAIPERHGSRRAGLPG